MSGGPYCLPVEVKVETETFDINGAWIAGAFFMGLILSGIITALCVPICYRSWQKKKRQDEEAMLAAPPTNEAYPYEETVEATGTKKRSSTTVETTTKSSGGSRIMSLFRRKSAGKKQEKTDTGTWVNPAQEEQGPDKCPVLTHGMVHVLVQTEGSDADTELTRQDLDTIKKLEKEQDREKDDMFLKILRLKLKKMKGRGKVTEPYLADFMQKIIDDKRSSKDVLDSEKMEGEEELTKKHGKSTQTLETELANLDIQHNQKLRKLERDEEENVRQELLRTSGLSEAEIDELMEGLKRNMAELERKQAIEKARQARSLAERLEKRRHILELRRLQEKQSADMVGQNVEAFIEPLDKMMQDGKMLERQKIEMLDEYEKDLFNLHNTMKLNAARQEQTLADKLRKRREQRMNKLDEKHNKEKAVFLAKADKGTNSEEFLQGYHQLLLQQQTEIEETQTELDQTEIQELEKVRQQLDADKKQAFEERRNKFAQTVGTASQLSDSDVQRIIKLHNLRMDALQNKRRQEKDRMLIKLQEKWQQRMQHLEEEEQRNQLEADTLVEQQQATVKRVLDSNLELTQDVREKILKEHERNMQAINNQLSMSKLKQQAILEHKLSQRRARLTEMRQQQEQAMHNKKAMTEKELKNLQEKLAQEEMQYERERMAAIAELRRRLAAETEAALAQQEFDLAALIGRLEVGHARRQAILHKQDTTLKQLQEQLEKRVTQSELAPNWADQIIQQHYNQVEYLNDTLQQSRERQESLLTEKIQAKRIRRQRELENQISQENEELMFARRRAGAGTASAVLGQMLMEHRHQKAMEELEHEMKLELEKSKEQLNTELQQSLEAELEEQKSQLLNQLAAASQLSKSEINEAVSSAVTDTGGDDKAARKLARELRVGIDRAKSNLGMLEEEEEEVSTYTRPKPRPRSVAGGTVPEQPMSGLKNKRPSLSKPKPAFEISTGEEIHGLWD